MSRFILGDCVQVMSRFPARAVDFILTDPPYLVGYKDRTGRTLAGDNSSEWLQPACHEMYRVLKNDSLMVSFYAWNRADLFLNAWKTAGFRVVARVFPGDHVRDGTVRGLRPSLCQQVGTLMGVTHERRF